MTGPVSIGSEEKINFGLLNKVLNCINLDGLNSRILPYYVVFKENMLLICCCLMAMVNSKILP